MKILIIHQYYLRDGDAGGGRFNELARRWVEAGHEVCVIAGQVSYLSGARGGRGWLTREVSGGVEVWRAWTPQVWRRGFGGRAASMVGWAAAASGAALMMGRRFDVVIASSPSLLAALPGLLVNVLWRVPWVFEVRDLWPESAVVMGVLSERGAFTRLLYALEAMSCRRADRVCVVTPRIGDDLLSTRRLIRAEQLLYIPNGAELALFGPGEADEALRAALGWSGRFVALYTGAHGLANGLDQLIDAAERLRDWGRADILIVALGDGPRREALREETTRRGLGAWVQWLDAVPRAEVPRYLRSADAGLVVLRGVATFQTVYPNKLFDALASGRAVVCNVEGAASALVEEAGAGRCVEAERPDAIACALCELADDRDATRQMGHDGYAYVSSRFSREELAHRYLEALAALVERR